MTFTKYGADKWAFHAVIVLLIVLAFSPLFAPVARGDYVINLGPVVSVDVKASLQEGVHVPNASDVKGFGSFPSFSVTLERDNASTLARLLSNAIAARTAGGRASEVFLAATSNGTRLDYELRFNAEQVSTTKQGFEHVDLSWRSFVISDDVLGGIFSINNLVPKYLGSQIQTLANSLSTGSSGSVQVEWLLNNLPHTSPQIISAIPSLQLFSFSDLGRPLKNWDSSVDTAIPATTWRTSGGFNLTFIHTFSEQSGVTFTAIRNAVYTLQSVIEAPGISWVIGDEGIFETSGAFSNYLLMILIVATCGGVLLTTTVLSRRYERLKPSRNTPKKRR